MNNNAFAKLTSDLRCQRWFFSERTNRAFQRLTSRFCQSNVDVEVEWGEKRIIIETPRDEEDAYSCLIVSKLFGLRGEIVRALETRKCLEYPSRFVFVCGLVACV